MIAMTPQHRLPACPISALLYFFCQMIHLRSLATSCSLLADDASSSGKTVETTVMRTVTYNGHNDTVTEKTQTTTKTVSCKKALAK